MTIGFSVMRLQPFHKGHQKVIDKMLKENTIAVLFIGSKELINENNPYSFETRRKMVEDIYENQIKNNKLIVLGLDDIHNPPLWAAYVKKHLPLPATHYYCGTGQDASLFKREGFKTTKVNRNKLKISGTDIRQKLKKNDNSWKNDVPQKIHYLVKNKMEV